MMAEALAYTTSDVEEENADVGEEYPGPSAATGEVPGAFVNINGLDYELMGDGMMLRLWSYATKSSAGLQKGLCVSGSTMKQMARRIRETPDLGPRIVLMIGTNEFLRCSEKLPSLSFLQEEFGCVLTALREHPRAGYITRCILLTLPPLPRFGYKHPVRRVWKDFNLYILGLQGAAGPGSSTLDVMNTGALFFDVKRRNYRYDLFERHHDDERCDLIHWNRTGMKVVLEYLENRLQ
ncbi:uncharacterized protein LOC108682597 [Hyalella azteca]|uniref:Uncharacterized protein LOC108682597 n=1 Tax=Hyalella azteca TaxID=294128 RepID=A0A8B7PM79_HYAAZ|nr:uncharacterized protein LOC108682597 [Hyalella azteca]